jgi:hypothetical protein
MSPNCHPCIDASECEFLGDLLTTHGRKDKHQKRNNKKTCKVAIFEGLNVN